MQRVRYLGLKWSAMALLVFGRKAAAHVVFDQMLTEFPADAYTMASKATLIAQDGDRQGALRWFRVLVAAHPGEAAHWFNLGFLLDECEHHDQAEAAFRRALELDPKLDRAWYGLGLVLIRQRRYDDAAAALKQNTRLQPMSPFGWYQLARVHVDRHDPEEARKVIRHLKRFEPKVAAQLERETGLFVSSAG